VSAPTAFLLARQKSDPARERTEPTAKQPTMAAIAERCGQDGLAVVKSVIMDGASLADTARANGARGAREVHDDVALIAGPSEGFGSKIERPGELPATI
jgi:hypothetical protein